MSNQTPAEFANVTAVTKANVYFDGKVVSYTIKFNDGSRKTLGLIYAGEYHFGTDAPECMAIVDGECVVQLDGAKDKQRFVAGTSFCVPGKSGFTIQVASGIAQYVCSYG
jgi:uncharacterized protein YaiE (UPF0345 family)